MELVRTHTYYSPSPVASVRPSSASVSFGTFSYPKVAPPTRLTGPTWLAPQRSRSVPIDSFCSHFGLGYSAELPARETGSKHKIIFIFATAADACAAAPLCQAAYRNPMLWLCAYLLMRCYSSKRCRWPLGLVWMLSMVFHFPRLLHPYVSQFSV